MSTPSVEDVEYIIKDIIEKNKDKIIVLAFLSNSCNVCKQVHQALQKMRESPYMEVLIAYKENPNACAVYEYFDIFFVPQFVVIHGEDEIYIEDIEDLKAEVKRIIGPECIRTARTAAETITGTKAKSTRTTAVAARTKAKSARTTATAKTKAKSTRTTAVAAKTKAKSTRTMTAMTRTEESESCEEEAESEESEESKESEKELSESELEGPSCRRKTREEKLLEEFRTREPVIKETAIRIEIEEEPIAKEATAATAGTAKEAMAATAKEAMTATAATSKEATAATAATAKEATAATAKEATAATAKEATVK
jgi:hypothetical protein